MPPWIKKEIQEKSQSHLRAQKITQYAIKTVKAEKVATHPILITIPRFSIPESALVSH